MTAPAAALTSVLLVSALPIVIALTIPRDPSRRERATAGLVAFAIGAMLAGAFLELLPEAFREAPSPARPGLLTIAAFLSFFLLERTVSERAAGRRRGSTLPPLAVVNLVGDALHNATDGAAIAAAFLTDRSLGIATTVAVLSHEIPHELGDFGVYLHSGLSLPRALAWDLISQLTAVAGAGAVLLLDPHLAGLTSAILPVAAASFIYIAASDLIPALRAKLTRAQLFAIAAGVLLVWLAGR